ncbi:MAG: hypothetical protein U0234_29315 [Sandaracinus sp.]
MRKRIEALADQLEELVSEDEHHVLVVRCAAEGCAMLLGGLELVEQRGSHDVVLPLNEDFDGLAGLAERASAWVAAFASAEELVPPEHAAWLERVGWLADEVHRVARSRLVVVLVPAHVLERAGLEYRRAAQELFALATRSGGRLKVIVRETASHDARAALAGLAVPALELVIDSSPEAMREAFAAEAEDPTNDGATRATALLTVAMTDIACGRAEEALVTLVRLGALFDALGDGAGRALAAIGAGSALWQLDRLDEADVAFARGVAIAAEARAPAAVLTGSMFAGHLAMRRGDHVEADARFDLAARMAAVQRSPHGVAEALVFRGEALRSRGLLDHAAEVWARAAQAARLASLASVERDALTRALDAHQLHGALLDVRAARSRLHELEDHHGDACHHGHAP